MQEAVRQQYQGENEETISLAEIPLHEIVMPGFQRERKGKHIGKIAKAYDRTAYVFPIVAIYKDAYIDIDGQQRIAALESLGHETAWVLLIEGIAKPERLAELFLLINRDRQLLTALEKYLGAVDAKDVGTVAIYRILKKFDLTAGKSASVNGKVPAGAVVKIHKTHGGPILERVLEVRTQAWGNNPSREANEGKTLLGLATFVGRYHDRIDQDRLIDVLSKQHPGYILGAIEKGRNQTVSYSDYVREQYNKGRRGKAKL